jgi:hypothetical protein
MIALANVATMYDVHISQNKLTIIIMLCVA